ncbi:MAG: HEAT repeat domain-containing protein [Pseudomonadota bacterium]
MKDDNKSTYSPFEQAIELEKQGQEKKAFLAYLSIPGAQYLASQLARTHTEKFLGILREQATSLGASPFVKLIEGDLRLALGQEALAYFREAATQIDHLTKVDWQGGIIPSDIYPVEPPNYDFKQAFEPFTVGPGSHRDNWLIRRFIALDSWDDAAKEFERIWDIHQKQALVRQNKDYEIDKHEIDQRTLQFAIDYAYFMKSRQQLDSSLTILLELLCLMDMDKKINQRGLRWSLIKRKPKISTDATLSYKEFIRLAYGAFKEASKEDELVAKLQQAIAQGQNATRRVLARIRYHQGNIDDALALELTYLDNSELDEFTVARRRGEVYEEASKLEEAAQAYQKAYGIFSNQTLADKKNKDHVRSNLIEKLYRLYGALGKTDKVLEITLLDLNSQLESQLNSPVLTTYIGSTLEKAVQKFQDANRNTQVIYDWVHQQLSTLTNNKVCAALYLFIGDYDKALQIYADHPELLDGFEVLDQIIQQFRQAGLEKQFFEWMRQQVSNMKNSTQALFYWYLGDYKASAQALAPILICENHHYGTDDYKTWQARFKNLSKSNLFLFLSTLAESGSQVPMMLLELLDLLDNAEQVQFIKVYETLINLNIPNIFRYYEGIRNVTQFKNYYDLALRLMRLYEKTQQLDKLRALGLRIASKQEPFATELSDEQFMEKLNACFSVLVQHADAELLDKLELLLSDFPDLPAKHQLARRKNGGFKRPDKLKPFGWANLPKGVQIIASNENVLSLNRDDKYLYAGHPWGVAVYDFQGEGIIRVALETAVLALAAGNGYIWAGTPKGLFRIQRKQWTTAYLRLDGDLPEDECDAYWYDNAVLTLALDNDQLWIGLHRNIQRLDISQMTLRAYSEEELNIKDSTDFNRILPEKDYVWADGDSGLRRYERQTDTWASVEYKNKHVHLIALLDGTLFGHLNMGEPLRDRPCLIDRVTLEVTPILIENRQKAECINGPFCYLGNYQGKRVFAHERLDCYIYERNKLKPLGNLWEQKNLLTQIDNRLPVDIYAAMPVWRINGTTIYNKIITHKHILCGKPFITEYWAMLSLPDGTLVFGGKQSHSPRYEYNEENPYGLYKEREDGSGGLRFISPEGKHRHISAENRSDSIMGNAVFSVTPDREHDQTWLCTNHGLSILDVHNHIIANIYRQQGLTDNCVTAAVVGDGKLYFSTGWDNNRGGRMEFDTETAIFTDSNVNKSAENALRKTETSMLEFINAEDYQVMPYLGGNMITKQTINGKTYFCGTKGLIIREHRRLDSLLRRELPALNIPNLEVKLNKNSRKHLLKEVETVEALFEDCNLDDLLALLEKSLQNDNPYYRAEAIAALSSRLSQLRENDDKKEDSDEDNYNNWAFIDYQKHPDQIDDAFLPLLISASKDSNVRVRSTALYVLMQSDNNPVVMAALRDKLTDTNKYIRSVAALGLAYRGELPPLKYLKDIFENWNSYDNFPYGARTSQGCIVGNGITYKAIAPLANAKIFELLLEYPPDVDASAQVFPQLGKRLRHYPELMEKFLCVYPDQDKPAISKFILHLFKFVGKESLPLLHKGLTSNDRVVRSNAARACGLISDATSIPHLIKALDLESGLSRASIVWALGELKAQEALPQLFTLYVDARNDEQRGCRRRGAGYRISQMEAQTQSHYDALRSLSDVGAEWDEIKAASQPKPLEPRQNETLLEPQQIFEAIEKIGAGKAQEFYQTLAGGTDSRALCEAAIQLAEGDKLYLDKNIQILRNLVAHTYYTDVHMAAAVSLLLLGDDIAQKYILRWLDSSQNDEKRDIFEVLYRVKDANKLSFVRKQLHSIVTDKEIHKEIYQIEWAKKILAEMQ